MSSETRRFTFLQVSDVHLDSKSLATAFPLTIVQRRLREKESLETFLRALTLAAERGVDAVLIPGDLWHNATVRGTTILQVVNAVSKLQDIAVIIAPGNRDCLSVDSPYNNDLLQIRELPAWPANVHVFRSEKFSTVVHPRRADVSFTGRAFTSDAVVSDRLLSSPLPHSENEINILMFHGALEGYDGLDSDQPDKLSAPFSITELSAQNFTYAALGHYHDFTEVRLDTGLLLGAYSGCPSGRSFYETGPRTVLLGTIEPERAGRWNVTLEPIEIDTRRLAMVSCDVGDLPENSFLEELSLSIEDQGGRSEQDVIFLHLEGQYSPSADLSAVLVELKKRFPQLVIYDATRPDYLSLTYDQQGTEWAYIEALLELKQRIDRARSDSDSEAALSGKIVEDALYYGLDAMRQRRITVRNVD